MIKFIKMYLFLLVSSSSECKFRDFASSWKRGGTSVKKKCIFVSFIHSIVESVQFIFTPFPTDERTVFRTWADGQLLSSKSREAERIQTMVHSVVVQLFKTWNGLFFCVALCSDLKGLCFSVNRSGSTKSNKRCRLLMITLNESRWKKIHCQSQGEGWSGVSFGVFLHWRAAHYRLSSCRMRWKEKNLKWTWYWTTLYYSLCPRI